MAETKQGPQPLNSQRNHGTSLSSNRSTFSYGSVVGMIVRQGKYFLANLHSPQLSVHTTRGVSSSDTQQQSMLLQGFRLTCVLTCEAKSLRSWLPLSLVSTPSEESAVNCQRRRVYLHQKFTTQKFQSISLIWPWPISVRYYLNLEYRSRQKKRPIRLGLMITTLPIGPHSSSCTRDCTC